MRYGRSLTIAGRHHKLIELIRAGEFSSPALAKRLKVSEQTIYRDIDFLKQAAATPSGQKNILAVGHTTFLPSLQRFQTQTNRDSDGRFF